MELDTSDINGLMADFRPERTGLCIALELDLEPPIVPVSPLDLLEIAREMGLDRATRLSFIRVDLVFTAQDENGQTLYCAVEIPRTVNQRAIDRARRNAGLLQQARNRPARAIVCSSRYENNLDWEKVDWIELIDRYQQEVELC